MATPDAPLPPGYLAGEILAFKVLVAPTVVPSFAGIWRPEYTRLVFPDGIVTEAVAMLQPSELALQHVRLAIPCWLFLGILAFELTLVTRRLIAHRSPTSRTSAAA